VKRDRNSLRSQGLNRRVRRSANKTKIRQKAVFDGMSKVSRLAFYLKTRMMKR